jgi:membrane peptidoglycan carboxypeptidase
VASVTQIIIRRRRRRHSRRQRETRSQVWSLIIGLAVLVGGVLPAAIIIGSVIVTYAEAQAMIPEPSTTILAETSGGTTEIYDSSGRTLLFALEDPLGDRRTWTELETLPEYLPAATVLWEDPDFLERGGFNALVLTEDLWRNWVSQRPTEADTSLTGRLVRNVILRRSPDQPVTHEDRALEYALVAEVNRRYSPDEVLEWHLNTNFYGNEAYGIEAAAQVYLGKSAAELTLDEAALLAAIPTAPHLNPVDDPAAARGRQRDMLRRMLAAGAISQRQFQDVINVFTPTLPNAGQTPVLAPDFAIFAREQAESILNALGMNGAQMVSSGRLRIITTLDIELYYQAECALNAHLARLAGQPVQGIRTPNGTHCATLDFLPEGPDAPALIPPDSGSIVMIDARTGEILTMNGPTLDAAFQPGPTLYPFVYLDGFRSAEPVYTPASMLLDIPTPLPGAAQGLILVPENPDGRYYGPVSLRDAMGASLVTPVMRVANALDINEVLTETAEKLGITSLNSTFYTLELLQRGGAISPLEVAHAYSIFAGMGRVSGLDRTEVHPAGVPIAVRRIEDSDGDVIWAYDEDQQAINRVRVMEESLAYLVNDILSDADTREAVIGDENPLQLQRMTAVVNGITADQVDNWTVGYTPQVVTLVRLGRSDRGATSLEGFAVDGAAAVWHALTRYIHAQRAHPAMEWERPGTIRETLVCEVSGMLPTDACATRREIFLDEVYFPDRDTYWELVEVNTQTGERASRNTPRELRNARQYFIPPEEAIDWWRANDRPLPPEQIDTVSRPDLLSSTVVLQPTNYEIVGGVVDVRGDVDEDAMASYQVLYGRGTNPTAWFDLTDPQETFTPGTTLALWDTSDLESDTYVLQLRVIREDGTPESGFAQVTVDNVSPSIVLTAGEPGQVYRWPEDETITITADVRDNVRIDRVDFYRNGQYVRTVNGFPFEFEHTISRTGSETFTAIVYDAVDNSSEATVTVEVVRADP